MKAPKNAIYSVVKNADGSLTVSNRITGIDRRYFFTCFLYGQRGYDSSTSKYPDYVHGLVWDLDFN